MPLTFIETNKLPRQAAPGAGEFAEVLNAALCGARNVVGALRWLDPGERFTAGPIDQHQLLYLMDGMGSIRLEQKDYDVDKGAGVYLGPTETATITASGGALKLFHLVVPKLPR